VIFTGLRREGVVAVLGTFRNIRHWLAPGRSLIATGKVRIRWTGATLLD